VRSGLAALKSVRELMHQGSVTPQVRIGVATGSALLEDLLETGRSGELAVLGGSPNLAARLQSAASPDSMLVSETTVQLVEGPFSTRHLPRLALKGFSGPVDAYEVEGELQLRSRTQATASSRLAPFIGREEERTLLLRR